MRFTKQLYLLLCLSRAHHPKLQAHASPTNQPPLHTIVVLGRAPEGSQQEVLESLQDEIKRKRAVINDPDGYTNVRLYARSKDSPVVAKLIKGEQFYYWETPAEWWIVGTKSGVRGFVHKSRIKEVSSEPEYRSLDVRVLEEQENKELLWLGQDPSYQDESSRKRALINDPDGYTNVRLYAQSKDSKILGKLVNGELFHYWQTPTDWWMVETKSGVRGFVHKSRIKEVK